MDDPQPGDFDAELEALDPRFVQHVEPSADRVLLVQLTVRAEDADALQRIADSRGEQPSDVVASLIRDAAARVAR
jgi:hypothetical protein